MTTKDQIEKEKALIIENLGIYPNKDNLMKALKLPRTTFYRRLKEIQEDHGLLPPDHCSLTAISQFNQAVARADKYWEHYWGAEEEFARVKSMPTPEDDPQDMLAHLRALEYAKKEVIDWGFQYECAFKALIYLLKSLGKYNPDILVQNIENQNSGPIINVSFPEGMQDDVSRKKLKEVNKRGDE